MYPNSVQEMVSQQKDPWKAKMQMWRKSNVKGTVDAGLWPWQNAQSAPMLQTSVSILISLIGRLS